MKSDFADFEMISPIKRPSAKSCRNLWNHGLVFEIGSQQRRGQIATFLILLMAAVLVMAMFITNLGQLSNAAVEVANATDSSALALGSTLASRSNTLCKALLQAEDPTVKECKPGSEGLEYSRRKLLSIFLAALAVTAVVVAGAFTGGATLPLLSVAAHIGVHGTLAGAVIGGAVIGAGAGAIGGAISEKSWSGAAVGAFQGASVGAAIGGGAAMAQGAFATHAATTTMSFADGSTMSLVSSNGIASATSSLGVGLGAAGVGTLAGLGSLYSSIRRAHDVQENASAIAQQLSGLPDYERMREQTLLQAMGQVVDDPNRTIGPNGGGCYFPEKYGPAVGDPFDVNNNGNTTESISCLDYWWSVRVNQLKAAQVSREDLVKHFIEGPWNGELTAGTLRDRRDKARTLLQLLERNEVECQCQSKGAILSEGRTVELWRRLYNAGPRFQFPEIFQPGPDQAAVRRFMDASCDPECPSAPAGWDSLDEVRYQYAQFLAFADSRVYDPRLHASDFSSSDGLYRRLAQTTEDWVPMLYNPKSSVDEYHRLQLIQEQTNGWFVKAREIIPTLPPCHLAYGDFPPVHSSQEFEPPFCDVENNPLAKSPLTGRMEDQDPMIDACTFVNDSSPTRTELGPHFPNMDFNPVFGVTSPFPGPLCKIDLTQKTTLKTQLDRLEQFVNGLPNYIQANYPTHFDNPLPSCPPPPPGFDETKLVTDPKDMRVRSVDPVALSKWPSPAAAEDKLDYTYTFQYECRNCNTVDGVTTCDDPYAWQEQRLKQYGPMGTPDLAVASQPSQSDFLDKVSQLRGALERRDVAGNPELDNLKHIFATTDADLENEFAEGVGGGVFTGHAQDYDLGTGEGKGGIVYFLRQVKSFYDQLQSDLGVPPAKDGRLPNPLQPLNDPIRGDTHPTDGRYSWQDSRGRHTVTVDMGPFIKASMEEFHAHGLAKLWGKSGFRLVEYCDNSPDCPYKGPDRTWVRIIREDPNDPNSPTAGWWKWNPFGNKITKAARVSYDRLFVKLCGTSGNECP